MLGCAHWIMRKRKVKKSENGNKQTKNNSERIRVKKENKKNNIKKNKKKKEQKTSDFLRTQAPTLQLGRVSGIRLTKIRSE